MKHCLLCMCPTVSEIPQYSQLVMSVCETIQDEVIALFDQTRHNLTSGDSADDKDSMETDDVSRVKHKDQRDGVRGLFSFSVAIFLLCKQNCVLCTMTCPVRISYYVPVIT